MSVHRTGPLFFLLDLTVFAILGILMTNELDNIHFRMYIKSKKYMCYSQ